MPVGVPELAVGVAVEVGVGAMVAVEPVVSWISSAGGVLDPRLPNRTIAAVDSSMTDDVRPVWKAAGSSVIPNHCPAGEEPPRLPIVLPGAGAFDQVTAFSVHVPGAGRAPVMALG